MNDSKSGYDPITGKRRKHYGMNSGRPTITLGSSEAADALLINMWPQARKTTKKREASVIVWDVSIDDRGHDVRVTFSYVHVARVGGNAANDFRKAMNAAIRRSGRHYVIENIDVSTLKFRKLPEGTTAAEARALVEDEL